MDRWAAGSVEPWRGRHRSLSQLQSPLTCRPPRSLEGVASVAARCLTRERNRNRDRPDGGGGLEVRQEPQVLRRSSRSWMNRCHCGSRTRRPWKRCSSRSRSIDRASGGKPMPIYVDPLGLQDAEKTLTSPVTIDLEDVPLRFSLRLLAQATRSGLLRSRRRADHQLRRWNQAGTGAGRG